MDLTCFVLALNAARQALENFIGWKALTANWLAHRVANDEFIRYEMLHFQRLRRSLPIGIYQDDDLLSEIRDYALEASANFDPVNGGASFKTFLYIHVQHRCIQFKNKAWRKKAYPSDGRWLMNETAYCADSFAESDEANGLDRLADRTYRGRLAKDDVAKALSTLQPETADLFAKIASDGDLVKLVRLPKNRNRVAEALGVSRSELDCMVAEVKQKTSVLMEDA